MKYLSALALAALVAPITAQAANPPATALAGSVTTGVFTHSGVYSCTSDSTFLETYPDPFTSSYIRPTASGPITLNLGPLRYTGGQQRVLSLRYDGSATLYFETATSGRIQWDFAPFDNGSGPATKVRKFSSYTQSYNSATHVLNLSFMIDFGGCSLPVVGVFHG